MAVTSVTPLIGVALQRAESPQDVIASTAADSKASFKIGTSVRTDDNRDAVFIRTLANIAIGATTGITAAGLSATAGAGNTYAYLGTKAAVIGDYVWVASLGVSTP
jgi:hypothetical protein